MDLDSGRLVADRYVVEGVLGHGAMGVVYAVRHAELGAPYALKVLKIAGDPRRVSSIQSRFLTEGRIQATLRHTNVLQVVDTVLIDGMPGLVMERVDGTDLEKLIVERGALPLPLARQLGRDIVRGVRAAHRAGHLHRDLKPANVLLATGDDGFVAKVADFGLAKVLGDDVPAGHSTVMGAVFGTPQYMSPEQAHDAKSVDARTDVFALGCILYELVTGHRAFEGRSLLEVQTRVAAGRYRAPQEVRPDVPASMVQAIRGALAPDAAARIPDCDTLLAVWEGDRTFEVASEPRSLAQAFGWRSAEDMPLVPMAPPSPREAEASTLPPLEPADASGAPVSAASTIDPDPSPSSDPEPDAEALRLELAALDVALDRSRTRAILVAIAVIILVPTLIIGGATAVGALADMYWGRFTLGDKPDDVTSPTLGLLKGIPPGSYPRRGLMVAKGYLLMQTEVTEAQWQLVMGGGEPECAPCPVRNVDVRQVEAFIERASQRDGVDYRLPTESEWEWAARGAESHPFAGSGESPDVAWTSKARLRQPALVCAKPVKNGFGLCDMSGNVWEFVGHPIASSQWIVIRGGSWSSAESLATVTSRDRVRQGAQYDNVGFRLARSLP